MKTIEMPKALHEVFGEKQTVFEVVCAALFASIGSLLMYFLFYLPVVAEKNWMVILGFILIADVLAGCIANCSRGTNAFYATKPRGRLLFIAGHVHILAIAWLLSAPFEYALIVWAYTIISAFVVNALKGHGLQLFIAVNLMCCGVFVLMLLPLSAWFFMISLFFMIKVMFSFAVDHYEDRVLAP